MIRQEVQQRLEAIKAKVRIEGVVRGYAHVKVLGTCLPGTTNEDCMTAAVCWAWGGPEAYFGAREFIRDGNKFSYIVHTD
jgi:hypothetical protein